MQIGILLIGRFINIGHGLQEKGFFNDIWCMLLMRNCNIVEMDIEILFWEDMYGSDKGLGGMVP